MKEKIKALLNKLRPKTNIAIGGSINPYICIFGVGFIPAEQNEGDEEGYNQLNFHFALICFTILWGDGPKAKLPCDVAVVNDNEPEQLP